MGKNYLQRQRDAKQIWLDIGEEMGVQKAWDYLQVVLRNPNVMGKDVMGIRRIKKVYQALAETAEYYKIAFSDHVEADVKQEELDGVLKEIWGDDLVKFHDRYPYIKKQDYNKGRKNWK